jgi:hypothetical protein
MHHIILVTVAIIATLGWVALPLRRARGRFVLTLAAVFIAGIVASPLGRIAAHIAVPLSYTLFAATHAECDAPIKFSQSRPAQ